MLLFAKDLVKPILIKMGWIKNGNGGGVKEKLEKIEGNDLSHIQSGITELQITSNKILNAIEDIKEYGVKIRK